MKAEILKTKTMSATLEIKFLRQDRNLKNSKLAKYNALRQTGSMYMVWSALAEVCTI